MMFADYELIYLQKHRVSITLQAIQPYIYIDVLNIKYYIR